MLTYTHTRTRSREYIVLEDLEEFLSEKDAKSGMDMLDADGNGRVNVQECCAAIARVFLDRKNLAASLKDAKSIVGTLETVIGLFLHVLFFFIYLLIWDVDVLKAWAGFASLFLGARGGEGGMRPGKRGGRLACGCGSLWTLSQLTRWPWPSPSRRLLVHFWKLHPHHL